MKEPTSDGKRCIQVEEVVCQPLDFDVRLEEDDALVCSLSGNKSSLNKINTAQNMVLNGGKYGDAKRCIRKTYTQEQCDGDLTIQNWRGIFDFHRNMAQYNDGFSEFRSSNPLGIICRSPSRFHIPLNLSSPGFLFDGVKRCRRTSSTNDLGNFILEYASVDGQKNVIINPYRKWIIDPTEENDEVRNIVRQSLLLSLGDLGSNLRLGRGMPVIAGETKSSQKRILHNSWHDISPEKSKLEVMPLDKQRYASVASDDMSRSCSSSISTTSSVNCTTYKGLIHSLWKDGIPYFVFMTDNEWGEFYVASPLKVNSSDDKTLDYVYMFHSYSYHQKSTARFNASDLVGKMTVSSSFGFNSSRSRFMETEFVLFGATGEHAREMHKSSTFLKNRGLCKKMTDIFRLNYSSNHKSGPQKVSQNNFEEFSRCLNNLADKSGGWDLIHENLPPNLELAAIVIKDHQHEIGKESVVGGWGLKFLGSTMMDHTDASMQNSFSPTTCHNSKGEKTDQTRSINVLLPAGFHGGPFTKVGGPSSLTERWRSGGHCDCGGWDLGCPLTLLNGRSIDMGTSTAQENPQDDFKPFDLFAEGSKQDEPILRVVNMQEGSYFVYFQSSLSALQSFSIAVALIHAQTPAVRENCI